MAHTVMAERRKVVVPYSEAAVHSGIAGMELMAREEDCYVNGAMIPKEKRVGCIVYGPKGAVPLLKSEAGWEED